MRPWFLICALVGCTEVEPVDIQFTIDSASCAECSAEEYVLPEGATVGVFVVPGFSGGTILQRCVDLFPGQSLASAIERLSRDVGDGATVKEERVSFKIKIYSPPVERFLCDPYDDFDEVPPVAAGPTSS